MPININDLINPPPLIKSEPPPESKSEIADNSKESKDENSQAQEKIPIFDSKILVKFPDTNAEWEFLPVEILRGKVDNRWKYPSPVPNIKVQWPNNPEAQLTQYKLLMGLENLIDLIESSINSDCQIIWKQAIEASKKDPTKYLDNFSRIFNEGKQREAVTSAGLAKQYEKYIKLFKQEKDKNGITPLAREYHRLQVEFLAKFQAKSMEELAELSKGI